MKTHSRRSFFTRLAGWTAALGLGVKSAEAKPAQLMALDQIRGWMQQGATIRATDPNGEILVVLPDGSVHGGLYVTFPKE